MYSAADLILAVQRKLRLIQRRSHPPGEFPQGWAEWFAQMRGQAGEVTGASAESMLAVLLERPPGRPLPRPVETMNRWQVFAAIWRQQWHPPEPQERGLRWFAGTASVVAHLLLGLMLLWLLFATPRFATAPAEGETVVQVEYIGEGTPDQVGGGPAQEPEAETLPAPRQEQAAAQARSDAEAPTREAPAPAVPRIDTAVDAPTLQRAPPPVASRDVPVPEPSDPQVPVAAEQRLTVSEPAPDTTGVFFLPPPTPRVDAHAVPTPELEATRPVVQARDVPTPAQAPSRPALDVQAAQPSDAPEVVATVPGVTERAVPAPVQRPRLQARPAASIGEPRLDARTAPLREARLPMPARPASSQAPGSASTAATPATQPGPESAASSASSSSPATTGTSSSAANPQAPARAAAGSGPRSEPAPGGWPTPARSDDWGDSTRNVPGGQRGDGPGLYNSDGSVRLAETPGSASPGQPPGTFTEEITDLDRNGTWLKRAPVGYEPTLFDRYWRPNETLLQEWVRRGIKSVEIPIPGTTKKISCAVSLLALGGACGISDPNLNEQPAEARPPPDVPFKPELQEDNGSVRPADGG